MTTRLSTSQTRSRSPASSSPVQGLRALQVVSMPATATMTESSTSRTSCACSPASSLPYPCLRPPRTPTAGLTQVGMPSTALRSFPARSTAGRRVAVTLKASSWDGVANSIKLSEDSRPGDPGRPRDGIANRQLRLISKEARDRIDRALLSVGSQLSDRATKRWESSPLRVSHWASHS